MASLKLEILTVQEYKRVTNAEDSIKYRCLCGHRNIIPKQKDKVICSWCGRYVFREKKDEFMYRMRERLKCQ